MSEDKVKLEETLYERYKDYNHNEMLSVIIQSKVELAAERAKVKKAEYQRNLLGQVLGEILIAAGVIEQVPLTGPQLILAAEDYKQALSE